ncbi:thioredoxin-related protein [Mariniflexile fucanivorans]|uniref:Thioredoxin-related protein n=1 Tax=Mariniflexile fucanivorans TaxID=264023 RepID=A0A4R1RBE9_9FLAO|nr:thioredoxin family protein [Mariniflexile fucanivorans]TCL63095.1 thioredoxin-related protein [Mariniflexile fucanivorans]
MKTKAYCLTVLVFIMSLFVSAQDWSTNFEDAKQLASKDNENIVLVFQGSDWCAPCMKLDKEIWSTKEYQNLAKNHFVMLKADFPRKKANKLSEELELQNKKLAETYNNQGYFPYVVVLDKTGKVLGSLGYEKTSPTQYYNKLASFK